ncbi:sulfurtransferase-like selenium metabolism protein YedF [Helicobacter sp. MIT 14-3879]|uniref:sulfurtransferase-like selenium metabolism protein YedF n=1 Tax=Helicobacter sp. MIT 14-3879 TaxID=2040649 RepID=UPI000E1E7CE3|nr:putative sulfurtransferase YedF [Helicobacter sp. MIT 14-3879]
MNEIIPNYTLDVKGESCPYPALKTLEALKQLQNGEILEVISDCPQSVNNIPLDAKNHGYEVLRVEQDGPILIFLIRK